MRATLSATGQEFIVMASRFTIVLLVLLLLAATASAQLPGDLRMSGGIIIPRGNFSKYADTGPTFDILAAVPLGRLSPLSGWFGVSGAFFRSDSFKDSVIYSGLPINATRTAEQYDISINSGLLYHLTSRHSSIRPYLLGGPGLYIFDTRTELRLDGDEWKDKDPLRVDHNSQVKFGLRAGAGLDLSFGPNWALGFRYTLDNVFSLHEVAQASDNRHVVLQSKSARFDSIMLEVAVSFSALAGWMSDSDADDGE